MDFSQFDKQIDTRSLQKQVDEAVKNGGTFSDTPAGEYMAKVEKLELGVTKKDNAPMLKAMFRITEGKMKKRCLFFNRKIYGTQNDANMIAGAVTFLKSLEPSEDVGPVVFKSYSQFSDLIDDIMEDIDGLEYKVEYDPDEFNSVSILECYED